jgi:hypothetical protein
MITIGIDAHKRVLVAMALDDAGREFATWRGPNSKAGWVGFRDGPSPLVLTGR